MYNESYDRRTMLKYWNILEQYAKRIYTDIGTPENVLAYRTHDHLRKPPKKEDMFSIEPGFEWGGEWDNLWLSFDVTIPAEYEGRSIFVIPNTGAVEYLCFRNDIPSGIINTKNDFIGGGHAAFLVENCAKAGQTVHVSLEGYSGHWCPGCNPDEKYGIDEEDHGDFKRVYNGVRIVVLENVIRDFCFDVNTCIQLVQLKDESFVVMRARDALFDAFPYFIQDVFRATHDEIIESCKKVSEKLAPALEKSHGDISRGYVGVIGHSHMDTAWLWPSSETIRKCARTYSKALSVMDLYPDYRFVQSSALHLYWMEKYYPDIFEGIKKRVAEGRYEPNGGVWVECDCNVTGGEAMVRQFLYGQRYTMEKVGYKSNTFWLPDTFGYSAAIPQIMQGTGVKYFYTSKIGWNDCNEFPEDSFIWRGLDGTEVLTHLSSINGLPHPEAIVRLVSSMQNKRASHSKLMAHGYGDGGGGPTFGSMEYFKRTKDLPGIPVVESTTVGAFMDKLSEERRDKLPVYDGELYLEFHRATLTSMHDVKQLNRFAEIALHDFEVMNVLSGEDEHEKHEEYYKVLLKNQFHDILPGTCITPVYNEEIPEMKKLIADVNAVSKDYASRMAEKNDSAVSLVNTLSMTNDSVVTLDGAVKVKNAETQSYKDCDGNEHTDVLVNIPAMSAMVLECGEGTKKESSFSFDGTNLVTPFYKAVIDENGYIPSLIDLSNNRQIANVKGAPLGTLWCGESFPTCYDNWEVEDDVFRKLFATPACEKPEVVSDGSLEFRIRTKYKLGKDSMATVDTVFYSNSRLINYDVKVDWQERHHFLKAGFDVNIRSAFVKNEIQYGHLDRPTTRNTTLEKAKFEVCNHKWSDISETNYGVAVLNNCKYGISAEGSDMRLSLLMGGIRPDPYTNFGTHYMKYALLPHVGPFTADSVVRPAYLYNYKPFEVEGSVKLPALYSVDKSNIICEAVKNAEDVKGAYVLRLYECERSTTECTLHLEGAAKVYVTNMLEEIEEELVPVNGDVTLEFRPFEIKTILVKKA